MKKVLKIAGFALIMLLMLGAIVCLPSCNKSSSVVSIAVESSNMPRLNYVEGQDLDLSKGSLTVTTKKGTEKIALNDPSIVITGYDKNTLGKQMITIAYNDLTTTLNVTVLARMAVEGATRDYYIGGDLDLTKGRIRIANDDGTVFNVNLSDPAVSVEGFSSATEGTLTLTVKYVSGNMNYETPFEVTVNDYGEITFTEPKTKYYTHEKLDVSSGFFTIKGKDGKVLDYPSLTEDMISGFDLSAADESNRTEPLEQVITVKYAGKVFQYTIKITYSDVTLIRDTVDYLSNLNWNGETLPTLSSDQGRFATEALEAYGKLSVANQKYVSESDLNTLVRSVAVYGLPVWENAFKSYDFFGDTEGAFVLPANSTREDVQNALATLSDTTTDLYVWSQKLNNIKTKYGTLILTGEQTVAEYLENVYKNADFKPFQQKLQGMLSLYDLAAQVPTDWTANDLATTTEKAEIRTKVGQMVTLLVSNKLVSNEDSSVLNITAGWLTAENKIDLRTVLAVYCYVNNDAQSINAMGSHNFMTTNIGGAYQYTLAAFNYWQKIRAGADDAAKMDTYDLTPLMIFYRLANNYAGKAVATQNSLEYWLCYSLTFADLNGNSVPSILNALSSSQTYWNISSNQMLVIDDAAAYDVYSKYMNIAITDYKTDAELYAAVEAMLQGFIDLTPVQQRNFLQSVYAYYRYADLNPGLALDFSQKWSDTIFAEVVQAYLKANLSDAGYPVAQNLLLALESYMQACAGVFDGKMIDFVGYMEKVNGAYGALSESDKTVLSSLYNKYSGIAMFYNADGAWNGENLPAEWQAKLDALYEAMNNFYWGYRMISTQTSPMYALMFASYETMIAIENDILTNAPESVKTALYGKAYLIPNAAENTTVLLANELYRYKSAYVSIMLSSNELTRYNSVRLDEFLQKAYGPFWMLYNYIVEQKNNNNGSGNTTEGAESNVPETPASKCFADATSIQAVLDMMKAFRNLTVRGAKWYVVASIPDGYTGLYLSAVQVLAQENLDEAAYQAAFALINAEYFYAFYEYSPDGSYTEKGENEGDPEIKRTYRQDFEENMEKVFKLLEGLTDEERAAFDKLFADMYNYYVALYNALPQENAVA